ncbi:MAG: septation protein A [Chromatiales bacterium]|jgi:intracellular septation protein|nr:septation protein A [Chromatiales bacterium]
MKLLFDVFPVLLFFIAFKVSGGDVYVATSVAITAGVLQLIIQWLRVRRLESMQLITLGLLVLLGGATLLLRDEMFIKWKPTVVNWLFAAVFLGSHFIGKRLMMQRALGKSVELPQTIWWRLNVAWGLFFIAMGLINLWVVYNFATESWVNFKLFGILGLTAVFAVAQSFYIMRHAKHDADRGGKAE